jgi:hypothetical protein
VGIGTGTTAERLQLLYKDRHSFTLVSGSRAGTLARVRIPFETGPEPAPEVVPEEAP